MIHQGVLDNVELAAGARDVEGEAGVLAPPGLDVLVEAADRLEDRAPEAAAGRDVLRDAQLVPLVTRIAYTQQLRPFGLEDTRNFIRHQLKRASVAQRLISDGAVRRIFQASQGKPRSINQLELQAVLQAAVAGKAAIDGEFPQHPLQSHQLYQVVGVAR